MTGFFELLKRLRQRVRGADSDGDDDGVRPDGGVAPAESATEAEAGPLAGLTARLDERFGADFVESSPFWLPPFLLMAFFVYGAISWNVLISLTDFAGFGDANYADLDLEMYARALGDPTVVQAAVNTFVLLVGFTVVCLALGLLIAVVVDRGIRFENTFRTIYLLPMSLSFVVTAQFWLWMYDYNSGAVNALLGAFGLGPYNFIGNPQLVLGAVVFALVWQFSGYTMVVYLAALRAIPDAHYEAAKVDGASVVRMYWRVIVPQLKSATISAAVVLMVFALKAFDFLYSLVGGYRPPKGSDILATKMVRAAYQKNQWAYGAAIAVLLFLMALSVIGPYLIYEYRNDNL
ncbi:MAG: carbohydrate ABC transporter permease [Halolamina sp.]